MMLPLTVQAVILCEPLISSPTPDAVTACPKEVNRKMATPFTTILQWICLLEANWQDAPDTSGEKSAAHNEGNSSTSLPLSGPSFFSVSFASLLPSWAPLAQHRDASAWKLQKTLFLIVLCSLSFGSLAPFSVCVCWGGSGYVAHCGRCISS